MRASAIEFRLRMMIQIIIVFFGFWSPWTGPWNSPGRISTLWWLTHGLGSMGGVTAAAPLVNVLGALLALAGAVLRVWGAAYLGYSTVHHGDMQAGAVMADGPYRYMRNPLYVGGWCMMASISLLMPPSGALLTLLLVGIFYLRLILGEEAFLDAQLGEPYREYLRSVPRLVPRLRSSLPPAGNEPHWLTAIFTEVMPVGAFFTMAVLPWFYDQQLMLEGILWSFIASLVARGLMKALIPTLACAAFFTVAWGWFHMPWLKAALIGLGIGLIVRAAFPGAPKVTPPESA